MKKVSNRWIWAGVAIVAVVGVSAGVFAYVQSRQSVNNQTGTNTSEAAKTAETPSATRSPKEEAKASAKNAAIEYVKAVIACDREKTESLSLAPISDEKFAQCKNSAQTDGGKIQIDKLEVKISDVQYSVDTDAQFGEIESAIMRPEILYEGKPYSSGAPNLLMFSRGEQTTDGQWLSVK